LTRFREHFSRITETRTSESPRQHQVVPSTDIGGSFTWDRSFFTTHHLTAGTDFRLIEGKTRDVFFASTSATVTNRLLSRGQQHFLGFFVQDVYAPLPRLSVALGVRVDFFRNFAGHVVDSPTDANTSTIRRSLSHSHIVFSPRLSFRYQLWPGVDLRGAGYQAFRAPTLAELYRQSSVEGLVLRENPRLRPEFLEGGEIGFDYTGLTGLSAHFTAYWNQLRRPISNTATARDPVTGEDLERTRVNLGLARIRGIEASFVYQVTPSWSIVTDYLYSEATVLDNLADPELEGKRLTQVPWFSGTIGVRYQGPSGLGLLVQGRFEGKKFEDADNHETLGGYYVIDSVLSWPLPSHWMPSALHGRIFLAIQNILDRDYIVDRGGDIFKLGTPLLAHGGMQLQF
jgi:outer membrane receptor protein involved in Fe transport